AGYATATEVADIGTRFGDQDLIAIGVHEQGHALVRQGRFEEGLRLLDEVMVGVTAGELSPIVTGLVYCNTIGFWQSVYELRRAREWTEALTRWCDQQPDMVARTCGAASRLRRDHARSWRGRGGAQRLSRARGYLRGSPKRHATGDVRPRARSAGAGRKRSPNRSCRAP